MKTFYRILGNNVIATITNMTVWFALVFFSYLQTKSVLATSISSGIFLLATAGSSFWIGSFVDHHKKKNVMLASSFISLAIFIIGFLIYITAEPTGAFKDIANPILWIYITILLLAVIAGNLRGIAVPTLVTLLIPEKDRDKANGMVGMTMGIAFLVVSSLSAFLVSHSGMYFVLLIAIILTIVTIVDLWFTDITENKIIHAEGDENNPGKLDLYGTFKIVKAVPGLLALVFFTTFNNFLGGVFMSLMDAYGLELVDVKVWGMIWSGLSTAFIIGGIIIAKWGLGKNPLKSLFTANIIIWIISCFFTVIPSIIPMAIGMFIYLCVMPFIEASEHTIIQKVVKPERQGRVFGFAQSVEQMASPLTAFLIGPLTQAFFIPFMTTGAGVDLIGPWFGTGYARGIALVFTVTGVIGLAVTLIARNSRFYHLLSDRYMHTKSPEKEIKKDTEAEVIVK